MAAASTPAVSGFLSVDEYLRTDYRPDVDYIISEHREGILMLAGTPIELDIIEAFATLYE